MSQKRLWLSSGIIAFVVILGFVLSVPRTGDLPDARKVQVAPAPVPEVTLRDTFRRGVHTISGSLMAPNACTFVTASAALEGASTSQRIAILVDMPEVTGVCLALPTRAAFEVSVTAPADLPFVVRVNGNVASTTLQ